ncbi:MAG: beta-galactosidase [Roseburia sp.]|nr:beta-galactosidase [Roseburia sp.]
MGQILDGTSYTLGVCYYPEHWPKAVWEDDLRRMKECGISVVRIAEFAWNLTEPKEGSFTFDFFDRFLDLCQRMDMRVIFGTPTATPPAWLTKKYPEVLNVREDGIRLTHGGRRQYNYNSPVYREKTALIVEKIAEHYGPHPAVCGWQIDNEINCELDVFYSEADEAAFRIWLREKYGTLEALNEAWGTVFWNQTCTDWEEVLIPKRARSGSVNPHAMLDYARFISHSARSFVKLQSDILHRYRKPGDVITTNGRFDHLDNHRMTEESLDFFCYDSYPNMVYDAHSGKEAEGLKDRLSGQFLSEVRSVSPVFGIMEQQSGANGGTGGMAAPAPKPGQMTLWTMQSIAHGADFISYFRWRTCTFGTEMYWHGILDYSGRENRRIAEVRLIREKLDAIGEAAGSRYLAGVAVIKDYDNCWDLRIDTWHWDLEAVSQNAVFAAAQKLHTPLDYVYLSDEGASAPLSGYSVLIYPHPCILSAARTAQLEEYVKGGGTLILGCRSGYKDMDGHCVTEDLPGLLRPLTGADIPEFTRTCAGDAPVLIRWGERQYEAEVFCDQLTPLESKNPTERPGRVAECTGETAEVLGVYENCYFAGSGALLRHRYGKGCVYSLGTVFTEALAAALLRETGAAEPEADIMKLPECCELAIRVKCGVKYYFVLNYSDSPAEVLLNHPFINLMDAKEYKEKMTLEPFGVAVLRRPQEG